MKQVTRMTNSARCVNLRIPIMSTWNKWFTGAPNPEMSPAHAARAIAECEAWLRAERVVSGLNQEQ